MPPTQRTDFAMRWSRFEPNPATSFRVSDGCWTRFGALGTLGAAAARTHLGFPQRVADAGYVSLRSTDLNRRP
jgi:hypothetical protein